MVSGLEMFNGGAVVPEHLLSYVKSVSGLSCSPCCNALLHTDGQGHGALVYYPLRGEADPEDLAKATLEAAKKIRLENLAVLAPIQSPIEPGRAKIKTDRYWLMDLPPHPSAKTVSLLRRAARDTDIRIETWSGEHSALVDGFCRVKGESLDEATIYIYGRLDRYLAESENALLFAARSKGGELVALAICDFTAFATAFYMFSFRKPDAPPGASDLLLKAIADEGRKRGATRLNLGLGINNGVEFFKKKWNSTPGLPYVETGWMPKKGFFRRIFGGA